MGLFSSSTDNTINNPVADLQVPYLNELYGTATDLYNQGAPGYYPGSTVAELNPGLISGINQGFQAGADQTNLAQQQSDFYTGAIGGANQYSPATLGQSNYVNQYINPAVQQAQQQAIGNVNSSFGAAGTLGSARNARAAAGAATSAALPILTDAANTQFQADQAANRYNVDAQNQAAQFNIGRQFDAASGLNQAIGNQGIGAGTTTRYGGLTQAQDQAIIDADKAKYDYYANLPWDHLSRYQSIVTNPNPAGYSRGSTQSSSPSGFNIFSGIGSIFRGLGIGKNQGGEVSNQDNQLFESFALPGFGSSTPANFERAHQVTREEPLRHDRATDQGVQNFGHTTITGLDGVPRVIRTGPIKLGDYSPGGNTSYTPGQINNPKAAVDSALGLGSSGGSTAGMSTRYPEGHGPADVSDTIQPPEEAWAGIPGDVQKDAALLATDPLNPGYHDAFVDNYGYWSADTHTGGDPGVTVGYGITPEVLDATGVDAWLPPSTEDSFFSGGGADGVGQYGAVGDFFGGIGDALGITNYSDSADNKTDSVSDSRSSGGWSESSWNPANWFAEGGEVLPRRKM